MDQSEAAKNQGICHTEEECLELYAALDIDLKRPALEMLRIELKPSISVIKDAYRKDPKNWYIPAHFYWGMAVRNLLREKGFGEDYFGIHNLDDIYAYLVEDALELKCQ